MKLRSLLAATLAAASIGAAAHYFKAGPIRIDHPYARATVPGQPNGGGFLKLSNEGPTADRLVAATSARAGSIELHTMRMEGDVMRMRQVDAIELPPGQAVKLAPGGLHLMFVGLKAPLKAGGTMPLVLKFAKAGEVKMDVPISATAPKAP